ncbi:MAG: CoA pyrophosphatase [Deltaproteobacteria bacterium CG_4_8_14_3_um_filter_45_9]|nr:MAG: CoA pyrophosphatase [Deltaproteobacteria bacterium CG03_land_8_20_14_0_80_45_14]PIX25369.1 MAG: CoA pyrophosphatase [Deltaproteobacteria bacterium CG_4_8_14_3_um_filter_45_9]
MKYCEKDFINQIRKMLSLRKRKVIEHPPFSHAAVLVPLFQKEGNCHLLFTKRSEEVKYHKGEISFPGGVVDEEDSELISTALREADEEIGLKESDVQIIGVLDDIVTITEFIVTPIVGLFPYPYPFKVSEAEIAELIEVPLASLIDEDCFSEREIPRGGQKEIVYAYQYGKHIIWGATARILKQFLDLITSQKS